MSLKNPLPGSEGSSPLVRGLRGVRGGHSVRGRIIPARAGFTYSAKESAPTVRDHPRSCGVYPISTLLRKPLIGSSPLVRGLRGFGWRGFGGGRIIPARAGFTSPSNPHNNLHSDHPRSCGVYTPRFFGVIGVLGSSPLVRGLPAMCVETEPSTRIIPARAGFTLADPWNPNELTLYQTPAAFTADLGPAPPGRDSAVEFGAALSAAGRAGRDLVAAGLRSRFGHHPDMHRRVATTSG